MPDLLDYLGFSGNMEIEEEVGEEIFEDHLPQEEFLTKIKKGELFEGKLMISRDNIEEGLFPNNHNLKSSRSPFPRKIWNRNKSLWYEKFE